MTSKVSTDQTFIQKLIDIIDINLENEKFGVTELAIEAGLSRSSLHRRLHDIKGKSSSQFIREYRLEKAMEMLKQNQGTASEIAYRVGFTSPTYFNTCFHNFYGYPPGEVKFQRAIAPPKKTFSKKIIAIFPVLFLIGLIVFNETSNKKKIDIAAIEKTIAVLPFVNNSSSEENMYFCNGIMAGIRDYLARIPEFSVVSRRSAEQYRNTSAPLKAIAKALDVNYIIEGHVQRIGNRAIISAELVRVNDNKILWSDNYNKDVSEIFLVQADVIQSITSNLETIISPNIISQLENIPTQDTLAYDHFLKGQEYRFKANRLLQKTEDWLELLYKAKLSYDLAIERDSLFAEAYLGLAFSVYERNEPYVFDENSLDEILALANKAIKINPNLSDGYAIKAIYFLEINQKDLARKNLEKALNYNPNNRMALMGTMNSYLYDDENYKDAVLTLNKMHRLAESESQMMQVYRKYGFFNGLMERYTAENYYLNKSTENDSTFNISRAWFYLKSCQFEKAIAYLEKRCTEDNQNLNGFLGWVYLQKKDNDKAIQYYEKWYDLVGKEGINSVVSQSSYHSYGLALLNEGQKEKGLELLQKQISVSNNIMNSKRTGKYGKAGIYYDYIGLYATLGEYDKAYDYMKKFEESNGWMLSGGMFVFAKVDVKFDVLRNNLQFKEFMKRGKKHLEEIQNQIRPYLPSTPPIKTD